MDLVQATSTPEPMELAGATYPVRTLKFRELAPLQSFLMRAHPSPLTRAVRTIQQAKDSGQPLDPLIEELLLDHAQRETLTWPPRVGSRAWLEALDTAEGGLAELVFVALGATDPGFDRARAADLAERLTPAEAVRLVDLVVYGLRPAPPTAPKAEAAAGASIPPGGAIATGPSPTSGAP